MTIVEPIPDLQWGKGSWQDYISNWRTRDTDWMQQRLILRYQTSAARTADWGATPQAGQVTFNSETNTLEMWHPVKATWVRSLMFQYLISTQDTAAGTNIHHSGAGGKGILIGPGVASAGLVSVATPLTVLTNVLAVDATGVSVKTGAATAKLTTDATSLVSDIPFKTTSLALTSAAATGTISAAAFTAPSATITNISMSGTLSGGGVLNGASGTIGSIGLASSIVTTPAGSASANAAGVQAGQGYFYGDTTSAVVRQRTSAGVAAGAAYVQVTSTDVNLSGTTVHMLGQPRIASNRPMEYNTLAGIKYGGPVIVQTTDPVVGNVPEGTIWVNA